MRHRLLGPSGLRVSEAVLGTMTFGPEWGWGASRVESRRIFERFAEAGGTFIDTANRYTDGTAERIVGECVAADRDHFVVATKYGLYDRTGDPNFAGNHRKNLLRSLRGSLERLATDHVDVLYLHAWDATTPIEEVMRTLDDVVRQGLVHYVAVSDTPAWVIARANLLAELRGWSPFIGVQLRYSLADRSAERELLPMARALGLGVLAWGGLASGVLTGKHLAGAPEGARVGRELSPDERGLVETLVAVAAEVDVPPAQAALAWLRGRSARPQPLLGARTEAQMREHLAHLELRLPEDATARLDAASALDLGFPAAFLAQPSVRELLFGGTAGSFDPDV